MVGNLWLTKCINCQGGESVVENCIYCQGKECVVNKLYLLSQ